MCWLQSLLNEHYVALSLAWGRLFARKWFAVKNILMISSLHLAWGVAEAKSVVVTAVCVSVRLSVPHSTPGLLHWPRCKLRNGRGCPLVVHYWADLQSVHGFRYYDNIAPKATYQRVLVLSASACTRSMSGYALATFVGGVRGWTHGCVWAADFLLRMDFYTVSQKVPTFKQFVALSNLNRFSKILHYWKAYEIYYKTHMALPNAPWACC